MILRIHPDAEEEFLKSVDFYLEESSELAMRFIAEIEDVLNEISTFPNRWPTFEVDTRVRILKHFPYSIVYRIQENEGQIIAIMHPSREPLYWIDRRIS